MQSPTQTAGPERRLLALLLLLAGILFSVLNATMFFVTLPQLTREFALTPQTLNQLSSGYIIIYALGTVLFGKATDRFGAALTMSAGFALFSFGSVIGFASKDFDLLMIGRFIQGFGAASTPVVMNYYIMKRVPEGQRGTAFGWMNMVVSFGVAFGPLIGGAAGEDWRYLFLIPALILLAVPWLYPPLRRLNAASSSPAREDRPSVWRERLRLLPPLALNFAIAAVFESLMFLLPLWLGNGQGWSGAKIGWIMLPATLLSAFVAVAGGRWSDRRSPIGIAAAGLLVMGAGCLLLASPFTSGTAAYAGCLLFIHGGYALTVPAFNKWFAEQVPEHQAGSVMGLYQFAFFVGGALGMTITSAWLPEAGDMAAAYRGIVIALAVVCAACAAGIGAANAAARRAPQAGPRQGTPSGQAPSSSRPVSKE